MRLVYSFRTTEHLKELLELCRVSNNLYNQALYAVKQSLKNDDRFLFYGDLDGIMKETYNLEGTVNYRLLKAQVAQQCLKQLDSAVKGYIRSIKDWSKNRDKYTGKPEFPKFRKKSGYNVITYPNQSCTIKDGRIRLSKELSLRIPQWDEMKDRLTGFQQVRIVPKTDGTVKVEVIYLAEDMAHEGLDASRYASIDIGVNNLATLVTSEGERPLLFNGRPLKSVNQWYNKNLARIKHEVMTKNGAYSSKMTRRMSAKRENRMNDYMHKVSRQIVNYLLRNKVGTLILGYNEQWKDSIDMGKVNIQSFAYIPFHRFKSMLSYKCSMAGIRFVVTEESYTSKCDFLAGEEVCRHDSYLGRRTRRGLFVSSTRLALNADVNGAYNIMRKVIGESLDIQRIADRGRLFRPVKYRTPDMRTCSDDSVAKAYIS